MQISLAKPSEFNLVQSFYYKLIDDMQGMDFIPGWQKGVYPSGAQTL